VKEEIGRCVAAVQGRSKVYAGVGVDVPHPRIQPVTREQQYQATQAALAAGADGLLLSREYHLMSRATLNATRDAVRDFRR